MAVILMVEVSFLQDFPKFQVHGNSLGNRLRTYHMPGEVLPEIQHGFPCRSMDHFLYRQMLHIMQSR